MMSRHCPLWYGYCGKLKWLERFAYTNAIAYPLTSIPLLAYCTLLAVCLLIGKFIIPTLTNLAIVWFVALVMSIIATGVLELRWSDVSIEEFWSNEQFWVIGGISAHLFAVFQGLLKVLGDVDTNFTVIAKRSEEGDEFGELYLFKWTTLLNPPTTLPILNLMSEEEVLSIHDIIQSVGHKYLQCSRIMDSNSWGESIKCMKKFPPPQSMITQMGIMKNHCISALQYLALMKERRAMVI